MYRVLLVDDDCNILKGFRHLIDWAECGFEVADTAVNGQAALALCGEQHYDLIVTDVKMPVMDGLSFIKRLREQGETTQIIIVSAHGEFSYAQEAMRYGVDYYLLKPVEEMVLEGYLSHIKDLLDAHDGQARKINSVQIESQYRLSSNGVIPEVKNYISQHYAEQLSVNMLAEMYSFSPVYLGRVFKKSVGQSFNEFLKHVRINAACEILDADPNVLINDLAEQVGFNDLNYFYKQFKQVMGCTPSQYRQH